MKNSTKSELLIAESVLLALLLISRLFVWWVCEAKTELFREVSPSGEYTLLLQELGMPAWPFGADRIGVTLFENTTVPGSYYRISFSARVANDGVPAKYEIKWLENAAKITLSGKEQPDATYILPFKEAE